MPELHVAFWFRHVDNAVVPMDENCTHNAGTGIHILVTAPDSKVDIPIVEFKVDVSGCVSTVPTYKDSPRMGKSSNFLHVEELAGVVLDSREKNKSSG